jgi:hypothetical protein
MARTIREFAESLGVKFVGEVADVGGGATGMARLACILQDRLESEEGHRSGRPTAAKQDPSGQKPAH